MILIGENIHIISKKIRQALISRDEKCIYSFIDLQSNMDYIDLNVGPAKNGLDGILSWLAGLVKSDVGISFDTTNTEEMRQGLEAFKGRTFINSASLDEPRLSITTDMALEFDSNLIALTLSQENGISKNADQRLEIAFNIYEKCQEKGIDSEKIFFDPLILPVSVDQPQGVEALNAIKMIKECFETPVKTVIGLSNISNGALKDVRPLINRVYAALAYGAGLDAAIIDATDTELVRILRMLDKNIPESDIDKLYMQLSDMIKNFGEVDDLIFDKDSAEQVKIIKTTKILLNHEIYSNSFTQI